ncbi:MAG: chlorite dismutase family protein [Candidatus Omnitrophica bacterium]|nr:chlorite dismutase family protein [Candidatus Omnitrophota bacterium]
MPTQLKNISQKTEIKGLEPGEAAFGIWSGGHFMNFGEDIGELRLLRLIQRAYESGIRTFMSADVYGEGEADKLMGKALGGYPRSSYCLIGLIGHDFYKGKRQAEKGFPRFTDPNLRPENEYANFLAMASGKSLERLGTAYFDLLLLHNPDFTGYTGEAVWKGLESLKKQGITHRLGLAPGPANGFALDLIQCFEKFHDLIDWAMIILNPLEPWPGMLSLPAAEKFAVKVIARVVDSGGIFHGDLKPGHKLSRQDHRAFRPEGWIETALPKAEKMRETAREFPMTLLQLASRWTLAQPAVDCVIPTLVQEAGPDAKPVEIELEELVKLSLAPPLPRDIVEAITKIGDNRNSMSLKGATTQYSGKPQADQWPLTQELSEVARRWEIVPDRDLYYQGDSRDLRETGQPKSGVIQALDRRLYFQLQCFTGCRNVDSLAKTFQASGLEGVLYADVNDPYGVGALILSENPEMFTREVRKLFQQPPFENLTPKAELTMFGRTYAAGREAALEDWLLQKPRRTALNPDWPWAIWYPLRRKPEFALLSKAEQDKILWEHAMIGRNFGQAGYAADLRLACYGLDARDNEFVLGLVGPELHYLSKLVEAMRKTQQTARYMQSLGPFFVGNVYYQSPRK